MLGAAVGAVYLERTWPFLLTGGGLLAGLVVISRGRWTPRGGFRTANTVTAVRIGLLGFLPYGASTGPGVVIALSLLISALDGVDGWLARRENASSEFGAFFDKEADALFLLVLCGLAVFRGRVPVWILGIGLLRYAFVVLLFFARPPENKEERSTVARYVYGGMVAALLLSFLPYPSVYRPIVYLAAAALVASFGRSLFRIVPRREALGGS